MIEIGTASTTVEWELCRLPACLCILQVVSVTFNEINLEAEAECGYDSVSLYNGSSNKSESLGKFCTDATSPIRSTGSFLLVVFHSDSELSEGRFSLSWTFYSKGWYCSLSRTIDGRIMSHCVVNSRQSSATSEIVKRCWSWVYSCKQRYSKYPEFTFILEETIVLSIYAHVFAA